ncbi:trypsin-like peptidase domain-containing protein [Candidatus Sumerlaeota bacterium]|nr:trypsin-like peptidase domain-containing protein [Candidatus Sumerlaeota bacterium]
MKTNGSLAVLLCLAAALACCGGFTVFAQESAQTPTDVLAPEDAPEPSSDAAASPEMLEELSRMLAAGRNADSGRPASFDIDLADLKRQHQNALVKIEFTAIENLEETKMNPTKSERYYSDDEPPHGTGFFIGESEILTNAHVVQEARRGSIRVKSPSTGNVEFKAEVLGIGGSETIDIALLQLPEDEVVRFKKRSGLDQIPYLELGDSDTVRQADPLAIFGYPQSSDELKIIQAKVTGRQYLKLGGGRFVCGHQFIEVGPGGVVLPGNSGGPALDREGRVVGIPSRAAWRGSQGWLIPSNVVQHFLDDIRGNEQGRKPLELPKLGITVTENFAGTGVWTGAPEDCVIFELGVVVLEVIQGSLADQWGIEPRDIVVGFANQQKGLSCALDFQGYRVTTGKMKQWPSQETDSTDADENGAEPAKLHLSEMILTSDVDDDITLWYVRKGEKGIRTLEKKLEYVQPVPLAHQGTFEKPTFDLWGDFVAQDFDDYNVPLFEIPPQEILDGGVLVTFVEPNSLASRRGMDPRHRSTYGFAFASGYEPMTRWTIIETVNEKPIKNLMELKDALRDAEEVFEKKQKSPDYDPAKRILMKERYVEIGFRTNTSQGDVLHLRPAFPIDEALECRQGLTLE